MNVEETELINNLFDFYHDLLTVKQQEVLKLYYQEDYSLSEIAEFLNVSRAAISDQLIRSTKILKKYEEKLHLLEKKHQRSIIYGRIKQDANKGINELVTQLENIE